MVSRVLASWILAMQLASAPAWSQSESDDETSGPEATEESEDVAAASSDSPPPPPRSPTDYRASEEISEDLSVSFPVDI